MLLERKKPGRKSKKPPFEEFAMLYNNMTAKEVGEYYGVTDGTVRRWAYEFRKEELNAEGEPKE